MLYQVGALTRQHVDDRNLNHRVATRLLTHGGTSHIDQYLSRQSGVVDTHIELETLVLRLTTHALADQVDTMTHILHGIHRLHGEDMRLVISEIGVSLDILRHLLQGVTILQLDIYHAAMDASPRGIVIDSAFFTPAFERTQTECPIDIPGPKFV